MRVVRPQRRWRLPLLLFVATCLSTLLAGALDQGAGRRLVGGHAFRPSLRRSRNDDPYLSRDGPFYPGTPLRRLCELPLFHPHAVLAAWHARGGDRDGAPRGPSPGLVRYRHHRAAGRTRANAHFSGHRVAALEPGSTRPRHSCCSVTRSCFSSSPIGFSARSPRGMKLSLTRWHSPVGSGC